MSSKKTHHVVKNPSGGWSVKKGGASITGLRGMGGMGKTELALAAAEELKGELKGYPGVFDVDDSFLLGKKEMQLKLRPAARSLGLSLNDLAQQVRHAFYGAEALRLQRDQDEVKVLVRYPEAERKSLGDVEEMRIRTPDGFQVPFSQVAEVKMKRGYASIQRAQRQRVIKVTADVDETEANANEVRRDLEGQFLPQLKLRFPGLRYLPERLIQNPCQWFDHQ